MQIILAYQFYIISIINDVNEHDELQGTVEMDKRYDNNDITMGLMLRDWCLKVPTTLRRHIPNSASSYRFCQIFVLFTLCFSNQMS
ncbi:hypothetical protein QQG55_37270 [Brugia pahangi]|uniref:Uncharacterized protein n=1 Tax=Brugia pahangi TaxID=6280 RepID=A0A0N4TAD7_BRUPA|nr:unnamed protein product [Brugia pahangi]